MTDGGHGSNHASASIGMLEHHLHEVFSAVRCPGEDFVYSPKQELFNFLDDYCDFENSVDEPTALLILGEPGEGKSALLSNWLQRRARNQSRVRAGGENEFVFWHAVGCSRQSLNVYNLIRRLMTDLKNRFDLLREVPLVQDRLAWELPRFLETASKRGKIVIVVDGLHRLVSNEEGEEAALNWLPLTLPPNVRVVMSATLSGVEKFLNVQSSDPAKRLDVLDADDDKKPRIVIELERRKWLHLYIQPLEQALCKSVIESYIKKSIQSDASYLTTGSFLTAVPTRERPALNNAPGFLLFPMQVNTILNHPLGSKPMFLRLILKALHWAASRGYDLWMLLDDWLESEDVDDLIVRILRYFEKGFMRKFRDSEASKERSITVGGLNALKKTYPWHPSFQNKDGHTNLDEEVMFDFHSFLDKEMLKNKSVTEKGAAAAVPVEDENRGTGDADSGEKAQFVSTGAGQSSDMAAIVAQSLGDPKWLAASQKAESALETARIASKREVEGVLARTAQTAKDRGINFIDVLMDNMSRQETLERMAISTRRPVNSRERSSSVHNESKDAEDEDEEVKDFETKGIMISPSSTAEKMESVPCSNVPSASPSATRRTGILGTQVVPSAVVTEFEQKEAAKRLAGEDASDGIETLPLYLKGGDDVVGFGGLLGNALSLLLTARHGLKESELWSMLATIQDENRKVSQHTSNTVDDDARSLIAVCYGYRGALEDYWRAYDPKLKNIILRKQILLGMKKVNPEFTNEDLTTILDITGVVVSGIDDISGSFLDLDENDEKIPPSSKPRTPGSKAKQVDYIRLLAAIVRCEKTYKYEETKAKNASKVYLVDDEMNAGLEFQTQDLQANNTLDDESSQNSAAQTVGSRSLGPIVEESLLSLLCALGVLHSPENQLLVLPSDSESLRRVIMKTFITEKKQDERLDNDASIASSKTQDTQLAPSKTLAVVGTHGTGSDKWHGRLINYFQSVPNSLRRCEELPWHLQICRQYTVLKNTIGDLRTFDLMYSGGLRDELLGYWLDLSIGPLFVSDSSYRAYITSARYQLPEQQRLLSDLDNAYSMGLTEKEAKKLLKKNQLTPFDVVQEFSISVENWMTTVKPSTQKIIIMLDQISSFMADFSAHCKVRPPFMRLPIDTQALDSSFGVKYKANYFVEQKKTSNESDVLDEELDDQAKGKSEETHSTNALISLVDNDSLYYYKRWMWTQFPVVALQNICSKIGIREDVMTGKVSLFHLINQEGQGSTVDLLQLPNAQRMSREEVEDVEYDENGEILVRDNSKVLISKDESFRRNFNVKKVDPFAGSQFHLSSARMSAKIKSVMTSSKSLEALDNITKHYVELNSSNSTKRLLDKYTRTLEEEKEDLKKIPFSKPSNKSLKFNSRYPSVDAIIKEKQEQREQSVATGNFGNPVEIANTIVNSIYAAAGVPVADKMVGNGRPGTSVKYSLEDSVFDTVRVNIEDAGLAKANEGRAVPISNEVMLEYENELERMGRLRTLCDRVTQNRKKRQAELKEIKIKVKSRDKDDEQICADLKAGEEMIEKLEDRLLSVNLAFNEAKSLQEEYTRLINFMVTQPPMTEKHVASLEQELSLSRQQLVDLQKHRHQLFQDAERGDYVLKKNLKAKLRYYKSIRKILNNRKEISMKETIVSKEKLKQFELQIQQEMILKGLSDKESEKMRSAIQIAVNASETLLANVQSKSEMLNNATETQARMLLESLLSQTGSISGDEFVERYISGQRLVESLKSHQNLSEARVVQLRLEKNELLTAYDEILFENGSYAGGKSSSTSKDVEKDSRSLEQKLEGMDLVLAQKARNAEKVTLAINDVKVGVQHIVKMLQANERLLKNIPAAAPVKLLSDDDISRALSWCEERVIAVNEALVLDSSKPTETYDTRPLPERQIELARLVHGMTSKDTPKSPSKIKREIKKAGAISEQIVSSEGNAIVITPRAVMIPAAADVNAIYEQSISNLEVHRAQIDEENRRRKSGALKSDEGGPNVHKFLVDSLATHGSQEALRKANFLANKKQGRNAGYGFALGDLLRIQGPSLGYVAPVPKPISGKGAGNITPLKKMGNAESFPLGSDQALDDDSAISSRQDMKIGTQRKLARIQLEALAKQTADGSADL